MAVTDQYRMEEAGPLDGARKRGLFVSSSGGHLSPFDLPDARSKLAGEMLIPAYHPTTRNVINMVRNTPLAYRVMREFRPDVVISNGAGVAFPFFGVAKAMGIPTVYLEVYDRIDSRTMTGRLCAPLSSLFLVQWPEQRALYEGSSLVGPLY